MEKPRLWRTNAFILAGLAGLALLAYWRSLSLPFIADDYLQIRLARDYGPISGWPALAQDALYRCRATSLVLTHWTEQFFGLDPLAYRLSSLLLHILNTWLVYALGAWRVIGWRVALPAAAFFAIYEGHQEAVIWYAALPELLVFFFSLLCLVAWTGWLESGSRRWMWYLAALICFLLALASKESAVALIALLPLVAFSARRRRAVVWVAPFALLAAAYAASIFSAQSGHQHFDDGTFELSAPFWRTLANSTRRLFWFWGLLSLLAILIWQRRRRRFLLVASVLWIVITFLPYSFLTYMPHVPSRHTYFASAGLCWIVGAGLLAVWRRLHNWRRWAPAALACLILAHNCLYLWIRKQRQFAGRAAPTEAVVEFAAKTNKPILIECFPYYPGLAQLALELRLNRTAYLPDSPNVPADAARFCWPGQP